MPESVVTTRIWITGASSGLGAALARTQPFDAAHVVDISRSGGTPGTEHLPADLSDPAAWTALEGHFHAQLGEFSGDRAVLLHCAGTLTPIGFAGEVDTLAYRRQLLLNAAAPPALGHAFLSALRAAAFAGQADVVMITSGAASSVYPGWSGYGAGKAAMDHWVRIAGDEQRRRGTSYRVWGIAPGVVDTDMQTLIRQTDENDFPSVDKFRTLHDEGQLVEPDDAARHIWTMLEAGVESGTVTDARS